MYYQTLFKQLPFWCFFALVNFPLFAQNSTVSGKITAASGEGLPGVSVLIKGTTTGTISNDAGEYQLAVTDAKAILSFSFVGYSLHRGAVRLRPVE